MTFEYLPVEQAIPHPGLRMVVVGNVPSPWGEAAKGIFLIKNIEWSAVRLVYDNEALENWAGQLNGPVAIYAEERPRSGWADILLLAERLKPAPAMLPADPAARALVLGLAHEILGEAGLCWTRRLQLVHAGLQNAPGFPPPVAKYLAKKYDYRPEAAASYTPRVTALFGPLPPEQCAMKPDTRAAFEALDAPTKAALDPILFEHRDAMYAKHLELPLSL